MLVDTNILLRLLLRDDEKGLRTAESVLGSAQPNGLRVTALAASEVLYVLHVLGYPRERIAASFLALLAYDEFACDDHVQEAVGLYRSHKLDFVDCYLAQMAAQEGLKLATLDKKAARLYARLQETEDGNR